MIPYLILGLSATLYGLQSILHKANTDRTKPTTYALLWYLLSAIFCIPIVLFEGFKIPDTVFPWLGLGLSAGIWALSGWMGFTAYKLLEVTIRTPIARTRLIFSLVLSVLVLGEQFTYSKLLACILIITAATLPLSFRKDGTTHKNSAYGVLLTLGAAFLMALGYLVDRTFVDAFGKSFFIFLQYMILFFVFLIFNRKPIRELYSDFRSNRFLITASALMNTVYYYLMLYSYAFFEMSIVIPVVETGTLITIVGGIIFLRERDAVVRKIIASVLIVVATLLLF